MELIPQKHAFNLINKLALGFSSAMLDVLLADGHDCGYER